MGADMYVMSYNEKPITVAVHGAETVTSGAAGTSCSENEGLCCTFKWDIFNHNFIVFVRSLEIFWFIYIFFLLSFGRTVCDPDKPVAIPIFKAIKGVYLPWDEKLTDCIMNPV